MTAAGYRICPFDESLLAERGRELRCLRCPYVLEFVSGYWRRKDPMSLGIGWWAGAAIFGIALALLVAWAHVTFGVP